VLFGPQFNAYNATTFLHFKGQRTMTNALAVLNPSQELSDLELMIMGEMEQEANSFDLIPTKIKIGSGGINQFVTSTDETMKEFTGIVAVSQKARAYWPPSENRDMLPLCVSADGVTGNFNQAPSDEQMFAAIKQRSVHPGVKAIDNGQDPAPTYACATCPLAQWGSSDKGKGQACKSMRRLVVLVEGWTAPALLSLPPTSVKVWDGYASALQNKRSAYFAVRTAFALEKQKRRLVPSTKCSLARCWKSASSSATLCGRWPLTTTNTTQPHAPTPTKRSPRSK
jgi:hypothetical protein